MTERSVRRLEAPTATAPRIAWARRGRVVVRPLVAAGELIPLVLRGLLL